MARMTQKQAAEILRGLGCTLKKTAYGEYRVCLKGGTEASAYYATDLDDAIGTAECMVEERSQHGDGDSGRTRSAQA